MKVRELHDVRMCKHVQYRAGGGVPIHRPSWMRDVDTCCDIMMAKLNSHIRSVGFIKTMLLIMRSTTYEGYADHEIPDKDLVESVLCGTLFPFETDSIMKVQAHVHQYLMGQFVLLAHFMETYKHQYEDDEDMFQDMRRHASVTLHITRKRLVEDHGFLDDVYHDYKRLHHIVSRIQNQWRESISNPSYTFCRLRLSREFLILP